MARAFLHLADDGRCPRTGETVISPIRARRINALMLTCGTYDAAGDFAFHVGLPAKSGVGGGIVAVAPGAMSIAVWSPGLDERGNSLAGATALARFTELTGLSVF
jgi:glutaminase